MMNLSQFNLQLFKIIIAGRRRNILSNASLRSQKRVSSSEYKAPTTLDLSSSWRIFLTYFIALIGNAGTGKSYAARFFQEKGMETFSADEIVHSLLSKNTPSFHRIIEHFGETFVSNTGDLDRKQLKIKILSDPKEKKWLEQELHPKIQSILKEKIKTVQSALCIIEIPLLLERAAYPYLNYIVYFDALYDRKIAHIMKRDHCTQEEAQALLKVQEHHQSLQSQLADCIIQNEGTLEQFQEKLKNLYQELIVGFISTGPT